MVESQSVEVTGPDVETAIADGLAQLGAASKDVIVEVLEEPSRGFLGLGSNNARVRLTRLAPAGLPPVKEAPVSVREDEAAYNSAASDGDYAAEAPDFQAPVLTPVDIAEDEEARVSVETLRELLAQMTITAEINAFYTEAADEDENPPIILQVTGRDLGQLIGRKGETLASLQYITRLIASRDLQRRANIVVDVEGYKARRESRLRSLALRLAIQATQRGRTMALEPMSAYERRIIHITLRDRTDVFTRSIGEGPGRKVTIVPVRDR